MIDYFKIPQALLPTELAKNSDKTITPRIYAFEGDHCLLEYPPESNNPLVRIHSECLTGDVFGSKRCDCGDQLKTARSKMEKEGGILVYLRQEGRGVGLYEKIKSYSEQDQGLDTFEAGQKLGHQDDMRDYTIAVEMLKALNIKQCRLMTNNIEKSLTLNLNNIEVTEIIPMPATINRHNEKYIQAKAKKGQDGLTLK